MNELYIQDVLEFQNIAGELQRNDAGIVIMTPEKNLITLTNLLEQRGWWTFWAIFHEYAFGIVADDVLPLSTALCSSFNCTALKCLGTLNN